MSVRASAHLILAAAGVAMAWSARHALDLNAVLSSWDLHGHLLRARHFAATLSPSRGFTAWFPAWHGGFPMTGGPTETSEIRIRYSQTRWILPIRALALAFLAAAALFAVRRTGKMAPGRG